MMTTEGTHHPHAWLISCAAGIRLGRPSWGTSRPLATAWDSATFRALMARHGTTGLRPGSNGGLTWSPQVCDLRKYWSG